MTRRARIPGKYLHVIVRGIGKQILFEDDSDYYYYLSLLDKYKDDCDVTILAYCLMENHVHLLLCNKNESVACFMKKLGVSYATYYNKKYDRVGHLFQDRYKSETISSETNLLAVFRYILNNPMNAGLGDARNYKWCSFDEYGKHGALTDSTMLREMIGDRRKLLKLLNAPCDEEFIEYECERHNDEWALCIIKEITKASSGTVLQKMSRDKRDEMLVKLKNAGLSIRQLERLTGINRGVIQKAKVVK